MELRKGRQEMTIYNYERKPHILLAKTEPLLKLRGQQGGERKETDR